MGAPRRQAACKTCKGILTQGIGALSDTQAKYTDPETKKVFASTAYFHLSEECLPRGATETTMSSDAWRLSRQIE